MWGERRRGCRGTPNTLPPPQRGESLLARRHLDPQDPSPPPLPPATLLLRTSSGKGNRLAALGGRGRGRRRDRRPPHRMARETTLQAALPTANFSPLAGASRLELWRWVPGASACSSSGRPARSRDARGRLARPAAVALDTRLHTPTSLPHARARPRTPTHAPTPPHALAPPRLLGTRSSSRVSERRRRGET